MKTEKAQLVIQGLKEAGVDFAAGVPDARFIEVYKMLEEDPAIHYVGSANEAEATGIGFGAVELSVDRETGKVHVEKYVTAADAGKALHPLQCKGQDEGSAMMGFGHTFYETYHYDGGQIINSTLVDYKVPTFDDVPTEFESILIEDANGPGPDGAKGLGEGGIIPVAPAVANAIAWSTGARVKSLPMTPEKVWRALKQTQKE